MIIKIEELKKLLKQALLKKFSEKDAELIAEAIMFGELSGKTSHGILRLFNGEYGILNQNYEDEPEIIKKTKVSTLINGNGNPGMLLGGLATEEVILLAKESGMGIVGTKGSFSSSGCLSFYLEKIAKENFIAIIMSQAASSIAPFGSIEPLFGTNPISFGIPANPNPLIFDMSTAAITFGAVLEAKALGQKLHENTAIDIKGEMTTDPDEAIEGSLLPFDKSYKGSGLAMMVEILAGILPSASFANQNDSDGWGNLFIAISPNLLSDVDDFKQKVEKLLSIVRNSKTKNNSKIRIPGEATIIQKELSLERGTVDVNEELIEKVKKFINE